MSEAELSDAGPSRAELRRAQVLAAAATCFNREGFHAASMASIAAEASMSVGQIYRQFENKEAVIAAIVAESLEQWAQRMAAVRARSNDLLEEIMEAARYHAEKLEEPERAALSLEFFAEAARNPRIGEMVRMIDGAIRRHLKDVLLRSGAPDDAKLECRLNMIALLIDGWAIRAVKNPGLSKEDYLETLRPLLAMLLCCEGKAACAD
ncbi:MAG: TetR/AcrR family transcriptional regulator [Hyphomonadaceae bacterium]